MPPLSVPQTLDLIRQYLRAGRIAEAESLCREVLAENPDCAEAHEALGHVHDDRGQFAEAVACYRRALALQPEMPVFHNDLGIALNHQQQFAEAIAAFHRAIELGLDRAEVHSNLGIALHGLGQLEEAAASFRHALKQQPHFAEAHNNLGNVLHRQGHLAEAVAAYRQAIRCNSDYPEAHNHLGNVLRDGGQLHEALEACRRALQLRADYPEALNNLGNALRDLGALDEAVQAYRRALEMMPQVADVHVNLGNALKDQGLIDEALAAYRRALEIEPRRAAIHSNLVYTLEFKSDVTDEEIVEEQRRWNERFAPPSERVLPVRSNDRDPHRRLRVGYVSADFREHVIGRNLLPLFRHHDHAQFEIFSYSGVLRPDALSEEFHRLSDRWRNTAGMTDAALAEIIRRDEIDILVDLSQHLAGNRLPVFVRRPAPVQVSFAGYPVSAGVEAIPYRLGDRGMGTDALPLYEEVFFPPSFWCYDSGGLDIPVNALPAETAEHVTFGSLNNFAKINERVLRLWAQVLRQVEGSRLRLLGGVGQRRQLALRFLEREGVVSDRVDLVWPGPRRGYLESYHRIDIGLDPFPYGGHTTSLDALWMGVPIVSLAGERVISRAGRSLLAQVGLSELAVSTEEEYVGVAVGLAGDLSRLAQLRAGLRSRMEKSVLTDAPQFARGIEAAYREMWRRWCASVR